MIMERKIGEIFEYNGEWYQCVNQNGCCNCAFYNTPCYLIDELSCNSLNKKCNERYVFQKIEKVGKPTMLDGKLVQKILTTDRYSCNGCCFESPECDKADNDLCCVHEIYVEIKQNKEDMEEKGQCCDNRFEIIAKAKEALLKETNIARDEKEMAVIDNILFRCWQMGWLDKYDDTEHSNSEKIGKNLKEFNLEAAKSGKPVCTRDGRKARIICFDKITRKNYEEFKIIALVRDKDNEDIHVYNNKGRKYLDDSSVDLMMLPEKKEGWVNVYKGNNGISKYDCDGIVFNTKEEAIQYAQGDNKYITTVKISWEE